MSFVRSVSDFQCGCHACRDEDELHLKTKQGVVCSTPRLLGCPESTVLILFGAVRAGVTSVCGMRIPVLFVLRCCYHA